MGSLSYLVVTVLVNSWIIGYVGYGFGNLVHFLPVVAFGVIMSATTPIKAAIARYKYGGRNV